ncbi:MAG: hypothetical protein MJ252_27860 [archaeon]|nr:hypothetical protein [archaeon]
MGGVNSCCKKPEAVINDQDLYKVQYGDDVPIPSDEQSKYEENFNNYETREEDRNLRSIPQRNYEEPYRNYEEPYRNYEEPQRNYENNENIPQDEEPREYQEYQPEPPRHEYQEYQPEPPRQEYQDYQPYQPPQEVPSYEQIPRLKATIRKIQEPVQPIVYEQKYDYNDVNREEPKDEEFQPRYEEPNERLRSFKRSIPRNAPEPKDEEVQEIDLDKILREWNERNGYYDPIDNEYDPNGWKNVYQPNEEFFNYDPGMTKPTQRCLLSPNEIYEGDLNSAGQKHGNGTLITPEGLRKGTWRDGEFSGWNIESQRGNHVVRQGKFENGIMTDKGTMRDARKNFEGDFRDDQKYYGTETDNRSKYVGSFKDNLKDGKGVIEYDTNGNNQYDYKYEGEFQNGASTGQGTITWATGDVYTGEVKKGRMDGKGVCKYGNGRTYEGDFLNGKKHGHGKYTFPDGRVFEGEFNNGREYGEGITTFPDGKVFKGYYEKGKLRQSISPANPYTDPNAVRLIKPNVEPMINPNVEPMANPNIEPMVNPNVEPMINPNVEPMENPNVEPMANPNMEPMVNNNVDPNVNPSVNPNA